MPIYQYKCKTCETAHEKLQKFNEEAPVCPNCAERSDKQEKLISSNTSFCLMGYGWTKNGMSVSSRR